MQSRNYISPCRLQVGPLGLQPPFKSPRYVTRISHFPLGLAGTRISPARIYDPVSGLPLGSLRFILGHSDSCLEPDSAKRAIRFSTCSSSPGNRCPYHDPVLSASTDLKSTVLASLPDGLYIRPDGYRPKSDPVSSELSPDTQCTP